MKKEWIAIVGSPRRGENTEKLIDLISSVLTTKGVNVRKTNLDKMQMSPCSNCEYCITAGECHIDDEVSSILKEMKLADGVILAAPSYNYNVSAQMKILLDRTFSLNDYSDGNWKSRIPSGKLAIVASVCKGKTKESMGYTTEAMSKVIDELGYTIINTIEYFDTKNHPVGSDSEKAAELINKIENSQID